MTFIGAEFTRYFHEQVAREFGLGEIPEYAQRILEATGCLEPELFTHSPATAQRPLLQHQPAVARAPRCPEHVCVPVALNPDALRFAKAWGVFAISR
jgi:hypothetical protein